MVSDNHMNIGSALRIAVGITLVLLLLGGARAENSYEFLAKWGSSGSGDGQFSSPYGVTVDSSGNVYVADRENNRIQKFSATGDLIAKWGSSGSGDGQFYWPQGVAVDSSGNVYVADTSNDRIQKFSASGGFIAKWGSYGVGNGQFYNPIGVAVDSSGNVYVADTDNNRIQKFSASGGFIAKWGSYGSSNGQFNFPKGVAVDSSGNVYVADNSNNRIQKFSASGGFIAKWGSSGSGDGQFKYPDGVVLDSGGNVYVADTSNDRIQKFSASGGFIAKWGSRGSGDGQFNWPEGVAVDSSGNVYVVDSGNHRIQKFALVSVGPSVWTVDDSGGADYTKIQDAINAAVAGDTILVKSGVYNENVNVNKQLILRGSGKPLITAPNMGNTISLAADGIILDGFSVTYSSFFPNAAISAISNGNIINNNTVTMNSPASTSIGIFLLFNDNTVTNNTISSIGQGVRIEGNNNRVSNNIVSSNQYGVYLPNIGQNAHDNIIFQNDLINNVYNAYDSLGNQWDNGIIGNHYGNYDSPVEGCTDNNNNGICDSGYNVPGGSSVDRYPLVSPYTPNPVLTSITITPPSATKQVGETQQFSATALDQNGNVMSATITWSSSNTAVGTIGSNTGLFTALAAGTTTITASSGGVSKTASVTVSPQTPILTSITITPPSATKQVGETQQFSATALDQNGNVMSATITWSSSNTAVGTIGSNTGLFTALAAGTTTITASSGSVSKTASVTVSPIPALSLTITPPTTINSREPATITVQVKSSGTPKDGATVNLVINGAQIPSGSTSGGGYYKYTWTPPTSTAITTATISATASMLGYTSASGSVQATVNPFSFSFVQLSDIHIGYSMGSGLQCVNLLGTRFWEEAWGGTECSGSLQKSISKYEAAILHIKRLPQKPTFALITGDLVEWNNLYEYQLFNKYTNELRNIGIQVFIVPGNHDRRGVEEPTWLGQATCFDTAIYNFIPSCDKDNLLRNYKTEIGSTNVPDLVKIYGDYQMITGGYYFDYPDENGYRFIGLDSGYDVYSVALIDKPRGSGLSDAQIDWLNRTIIKDRTIIFMHHPAIDDIDAASLSAFGYIWTSEYNIIDKNRQKFYDITRKNNVKLVLGGHVGDPPLFMDALGIVYTPQSRTVNSPIFVETRSTSQGAHGYSIINMRGKIDITDISLIGDTSTEDERKTISIFSPADIHVYDEYGRHTGVNTSGGIEHNIPDSFYIEAYTMGNTTMPAMIILYNTTLKYNTKISSNFSKENIVGNSATFSLLIEDREGTTSKSIRYNNVSINRTSQAYIDYNQTQGNYTMQVDMNNDSIKETTKAPDNITINNAPVVTILSPSSGINIVKGQAVLFSSTYTDEDVNLTGEWISDIDNTIGYGDFTTTNLTVGTHKIFVQYLDTGYMTGTASIILTVSEPAPPASSSGGGGGGGGSGGGGGGTSGENYSNIVVKEKYDMHIYKDKVTSYAFTNTNNPIRFVNITGNVNAGEINTAVEVLKDTSTLVKSKAPGAVNKNANIWVGTSGFAGPNNIKEAVVKFRVENSWLSGNNFAGSDIKLFRWNKTEWVQLETSEITKDDTYTHFEGKTNMFSPFAISSIKEAQSQVLSATTNTATEQKTASFSETAIKQPSTKASETNLNWILFVFGALVLVGIIRAVYLKKK